MTNRTPPPASLLARIRETLTRHGHPAPAPDASARAHLDAVNAATQAKTLADARNTRAARREATEDARVYAKAWGTPPAAPTAAQRPATAPAAGVALDADAIAAKAWGTHPTH